MVSLLLAGCEPLLPGSSNSDQQVVQVMVLVVVQCGGYFAGLKQTQSSITFKHTIATIVTDVFSLNLNSLQPNFAASSADTSILQFSGLWRSHCGVAHKTDTRTQLQFMVNYHPSIEKFRWLSSNRVQSHHSCEANKYQISKPFFRSASSYRNSKGLSVNHWSKSSRVDRSCMQMESYANYNLQGK